MAWFKPHREGQGEFKAATFCDHRREFGSIFCRLCGAALEESDGRKVGDVEAPDGTYYSQVPLKAHHTEPYKDAGHDTVGILTCDPCHKELHVGNKGNLSILGQLIASVVKENPGSDLTKYKKK